MLKMLVFIWCLCLLLRGYTGAILAEAGIKGGIHVKHNTESEPAWIRHTWPRYRRASQHGKLGQCINKSP